MVMKMLSSLLLLCALLLTCKSAPQYMSPAARTVGSQLGYAANPAAGYVANPASYGAANPASYGANRAGYASNPASYAANQAMAAQYGTGAAYPQPSIVTRKITRDPYSGMQVESMQHVFLPGMLGNL